jgi:Cytochrome P450
LRNSYDLRRRLPFIGRFTTEEVTIADVTIPAGSVVVLCLASTNLDGSETSSVTVTEDGKIRPKRHRSFGAGVHRCLGKALARMELTVIVAEWLCAVPDFELERGFTPSFTFTQGGAVTPSSLPLRWTAARALRLRNRAPAAAGWGERGQWAAVVDHAIHPQPHDGCINDMPIAAVRVAFAVAVSGLA